MGLEAIPVGLQAGIRDPHKPHSFVAGANVRDEDAELFLAAFQLLDGEIMLRHFVSPCLNHSFTHDCIGFIVAQPSAAK